MKILTMMLVLSSVALTSATVIQVPADQATIQDGIDAAADGDTVLVAQGTYVENINFNGKAITVASHYAIDQDSLHIVNTIIDGSGASNADRASVVYFESGEDTTSVLMGFTITGGRGTKTGGTVFGKTLKGGGIFCKDSGPRICNNRIVFNTIETKRDGWGGGIYAYNISADPFIIIEDNDIANNSITANDIGFGGGVMVDGMHGRMTGNTITANSLSARSTCWGGAVVIGYAYEMGNATFHMESNTITHNVIESTGNSNAISAVYVRLHQVTIKGNTIYKNTGVGGWVLGVGMYVSQAREGTLIEGNTISNNTTKSRATGGGLYLNEGSALVIRNNYILENSCSNSEVAAGGGIFINACTDVLCDSNTVIGNHVTYVCGGIYYYHSSGNIRNNLVAENSSQNAVGIAGYNAQMRIQNNRIIDNTATRYGGGISMIEDCQVIAENNLILNNKAGAGGGVGVWTLDNHMAMGEEPPEMDMPENSTESVVLQTASTDSLPNVRTLVLVNNTICNNKADEVNGYGGGLFLKDWNVLAMNNIIWGNKAPTSPNIRNMNGVIRLFHSCVEGGYPGESIIKEHPSFADDDRHLSETSPCLGAGVMEMEFDGYVVTAPVADLGGNARPQPAGSNPDLGAWEHALARPAVPHIIHVPEDFETIQAGIDAAMDGDTVLVADGTYVENISFKGKAITVASHYLVHQDTSHISNTIIDGSGASNADRASVVYFESGEDTTSVLMGFTITGGAGTKTGGSPFGKKINGGGIFCKNSSARIVRNIIRDNSAIGKQESGGGGIYASAANPSKYFLMLEHNLILRNVAESSLNDAAGGGVWTDINSSILYNTFIENSSTSETGAFGAAVAGGGYANQKCQFHFLHNRVEANECTTNRQDETSFGAVFTMFDSNDIQDNVFLSNKNLGTSYARAAALIVFRADSSTLIKSNHFKGNISKGESRWGAALFVDQSSNVLTEENISEENICNIGPGLYYFHSNGEIRKNRVVHNQALRLVGGIMIYKSDILIDANIVSENQSNGGPGGVWLEESKGIMQNNFVLRNKGKYAPGIGVFERPPGAGSASGIDYQDAVTDGEIFRKTTTSSSRYDVDAMFIVNNTVCYNTGTYGGGLYTILKKTVAINNIFYANKASNKGNVQIYNEGGNLTVAYNLVQHGWEGEGNKDIDPQFADSTFSLSDSSLCIGAGTASFIFDDIEILCPAHDCHAGMRPNPADTNPDIGAFEHELGDPVTDVLTLPDAVPTEYTLSQNYPNPFNPTTTIQYSLPEPGVVTLTIYNLAGQAVRTFTENAQPVGTHTVTWDAKDDFGRPVGSGVYVYRIHVVEFQEGREAFVAERKMVLLK